MIFISVVSSGQIDTDKYHEVFKKLSFVLKKC